MASVYHGGATGVATVPFRVLEGTTTDGRFGASVAGTGDVDGDGYADLVVGAPLAGPGGRQNAGTASLFHGGATGVVLRPARVLEGAVMLEHLGASLAGAGDVNGDGFADLVVGAPNANPGGRSWAGTANVFLGGARGLAMTPTCILEGTSEFDQFGFSVARTENGPGDGLAAL
jgi:hypothetical protein